jgi:hypothetical protein
MTVRFLIRCTAALLAVASSWLAPRAAEARPPYLVMFQADPMRKADVDGCGTCHVNQDGGGARNDFGTAFERANDTITPLLRASHPQNFKFESATLPDGSKFHFSDPTSKAAVYEKNGTRVVVDIAAIATPAAARVPPAANRMTFFVTSAGVAAGGKLGGLAGADRVCQDLAKAAGADDRTWRAYLSTTFQDQPAVNAGDRIGGGPWYDAKGVMVARGPVDLHQKGRVKPEVLRTEKGDPVVAGGASGVRVFTGTNADGTAAAGRTCGNWTTAEGEAVAADPAAGWNTAAPAACGPTEPASAPRLYCFAAR